MANSDQNLERMKQRIIIFESACCTGWAFTYEADDDLQAMIVRHVDSYNSSEQWLKRNHDGGVSTYDSIEEVDLLNDDEEKFSTIEELFEYFKGDGEGRHVDAAWVVNMLLSDPADFDNWIPK